MIAVLKNIKGKSATDSTHNGITVIKPHDNAIPKMDRVLT